MAASVENKKLMKKLRKHQQNMINRENLKVSENPKAIICVSNGGLENGVSFEEIESLFSVHGDCDVMMLPRKSYCIVCFTCEQASESAYTSLNGHKLKPNSNRNSEVILYLSYIEKAPDSLSPSSERPPGLILLEDYVSQDYADSILQAIHWEDDMPAPGGTSASQRELKHRKVKHYGYEFKYSINNVDPDDPLPDGIPTMFDALLEKLLNEGVIKHRPDQLTVNQYLPGQGIPPHVDTPSAFEDGLVSLSLGSQVIMEFRHPDGGQLSVLLLDRSALVMTGESRYVWSHGITPRKSDIVTTATGGLTLSNRGLRTSFTFRKITGVKHGEEKSEQPNLPDSDDSAAQLESQLVHQVYEEIADHFSGTRHTPWPRIAEFLRQQPCGSVLVDIGCGNGKYFGINKHLYEVGSDRSSNLAQICQQRGFQTLVSDILAIPVRSGTCDVCLCIAVIHHLSTQERRLRAVKELLRILRPGGKALIYVWAMEQQLNKVKSKYLKGKKQAQDTTETVSKDRDDKDDSKNKRLSDGSVDKAKDSNCCTNENDSCCSSDGTLGAGGDSTGTDRVAAETKKLTIGSCQDTNIHRDHAQRDLCVNCDDHNLRIDHIETDALSEKDNVRETEHRCTVSAGVGDTSLDNNRVIINETESDTGRKSEHTESVICTSTTGANRTEQTYGIGEQGTSENLETYAESSKSDVDPKTSSDSQTKTPLAVHVNRTQFQQQDVLVPWQLKNKHQPKEAGSTYHRFYHVFEKGELEKLCLSVENCTVIDSYYDQGNWAVILQKIA